MEPEGSPPPSQKPTNYLFPDPYQYFPSILSYLLKILLIVVLSFTRRFEIRFLSSGFSTKTFSWDIRVLLIGSQVSIKCSQTQLLIFVLLGGVST